METLLWDTSEEAVGGFWTGFLANRGADPQNVYESLHGRVRFTGFGGYPVVEFIEFPDLIENCGISAIDRTIVLIGIEIFFIHLSFLEKSLAKTQIFI